MSKIIHYGLIILVSVACTEQKTETRKYVNGDEFDSSVKPGDNFFRYINGNWYDTATIAPDQVGVGSYRFLNIPQKKLLQNILEGVSVSENKPGSIEQMVGDFYASGMDTTAVNKRGFEPIKPLLDRIDMIKDVPGLMKFVADELKEYAEFFGGIRMTGTS